MNKRAVLLLSGGMDSTTLLGKLLLEGWKVSPVLIDYNQKHSVELICAQNIIKEYQRRGASVQNAKMLSLDLGQIGGSALLDAETAVPDNMQEQIKTVVPFRNMLMTTLAASYAGTKGITDVFITPVREDFEVYRDCRLAFFESLSTTLSLGAVDDKKVTVHTPYIFTWKKDIIKWGLANNVPYNLTHSCYKGAQPACGECPACRERLVAFKENGVPDAIPYAKIPEVLV